MLLSSLFWFVVFSKPVFWMVFSSNYGLGTFLWLCLIFTLLFIEVARRRFHFSNMVGCGWFLYLVYFFACLFGGGGQSVASVAYSFLLLIPVIFGFVHFNSKHSIEAFVESIAIGVVLALVVVSLSSILFGIGDFSSRDSGIGEVGPNTIGLISALGAYLSFGMAAQAKGARKIAWIIFSLFSCFILYLAFSKTSIIALFVALFFSLSFLSKYYLRYILVASAILFLSDYWSFFYDGISSGDITFTGRTLLWAGIVDYIQGGAILFGSGYNSSVEISRDVGFQIFGVDSFTHAHNAYLEAYINSGIFGVLLVLLMICCWIVCLAKAEDSVYHITLRGVFIIFMVRSLTESSFIQPGSSDSVLFFVLFLYYSWRLRAQGPSRCVSTLR